jgi:hypothetical protein
VLTSSQATFFHNFIDNAVDVDDGDGVSRTSHILSEIEEGNDDDSAEALVKAIKQRAKRRNNEGKAEAEAKRDMDWGNYLPCLDDRKMWIISVKVSYKY